MFSSIPPSPTKEYADQMDAIDPLKRFRDEFSIPRAPSTCGRDEAIYFGGMGLGLQPKRTPINLQSACRDWAQLGGLSYTDGARPLRYPEVECERLLVPLLGARHLDEVAVMNACSLNANLLLTSFYRPSATRNKVLIEGGAFCSDYHVIRGQLALHDVDERDALIQVWPRRGAHILETDDILSAIRAHAASLCVIWLGCTQYMTGQLFDVRAICSAAHQLGILVGLDLAHGVGNVPLLLHEWNVDFGAFCGYKYLCGGGGAIGGIFVHRRHHADASLKRLRGWWGQNLQQRYTFSSEFRAASGAKAWAVSQTPLLQCVALETALRIYTAAGMDRLRRKSVRLSAYLELLIQTYLGAELRLITPSQAQQRGCQLSLLVLRSDTQFEPLCAWLLRHGVVCSVHEPDIVRIAPFPLFNTFGECWDFVRIVSAYFGRNGRAKL